MRLKQPAKPTKKRKSNLEDQHQKALIKWARLRRLNTLLPNVETGATLGDYLFHIPNGGKRGKIEAANFKAMGTKAGVSDLFLPIPLHDKAGLWIELKAPYTDTKQKNYPTKEQREWLKRMEKAGYAAALCYGWQEAKEQIENYLQGQDHDQHTATI